MTIAQSEASILQRMKLGRNTRLSWMFVRGCCFFVGVASAFVWQSASGGEPDLSQRGEWRWESDQPGFHPSLIYPLSYTVVGQGIGIGFLGSLDKSITGWTGPSVHNFEDAFTKGPRWDDDEWYWNYLAHPAAGSEMYLRARAQGYGPLGSFLFAAAGSTIWEFGIESWYERPSNQDLIVTPIAGALFGEARFRAKRALLEADTGFSRTLAFAIDPVQSLSEVIGDVFGQDWREPAFRKATTSRSQSYPIFTTDIGSNKGNVSVMVRCRIAF